MNRRVATVLVGTAIALVGTSLCVPTEPWLRVVRPGAPLSVHYTHWSGPLAYEWVWVRTPPVQVHGLHGYAVRHVSWPVLIGSQTAILLLGGGLMTWAVRRERRRRAEAT